MKLNAYLLKKKKSISVIVVVKKICAVIEVIEVFKFYKTSITSHTTCYSQIVSSLILKEKGFLDFTTCILWHMAKLVAKSLINEFI